MPWGSWGPGGGGLNGTGAYESPDVDFIKHVTKLTEKAEGITEAELDADLAAFIPQAEVGTAFAVGTALFDSAGLTARQVYGLQVAVAYRVGAAYLRGVASQIATGTGAPRKTEASAALSDLADLWDNDDPPGEAQRWDAKVQGETGAGETSAAGKGGVGPLLVTAGVDPNLSVVLPSERIRQLDERDDRWAGSD